MTAGHQDEPSSGRSGRSRNAVACCHRVRDTHWPDVNTTPNRDRNKRSADSCSTVVLKFFHPKWLDSQAVFSYFIQV